MGGPLLGVFWRWIGCAAPIPASPDVNVPARPVDEIGALSVVGSHITGRDGAPVQLAGVSTQWLNWERQYASSREVLEWMRDQWGVQVLRVANGVEGPEGYLRNPDRLALVEQIVQNAIDAGVYVIVDWHTHEIAHRDEAAAFFGTLAAEFGEAPNVIWETFNEPVYADWSTELKPYHEAVIAAIRKHDPDNLIIVGTPEWDQRPDLAAKDRIADPNLLYALHFYSCLHGEAVRNRAQAALDAGLPLIVSEWGATGGFVGVCAGSARSWIAWVDDHQLSWVAWKLSADGDASSLLRRTAPTTGGFGPAHLTRHGALVRELLLAHRGRVADRPSKQ